MAARGLGVEAGQAMRPPPQEAAESAVSAPGFVEMHRGTRSGEADSNDDENTGGPGRRRDQTRKKRNDELAGAVGHGRSEFAVPTAPPLAMPSTPAMLAVIEMLSAKPASAIAAYMTDIGNGNASDA